MKLFLYGLVAVVFVVANMEGGIFDEIAFVTVPLFYVSVVFAILMFFFESRLGAMLQKLDNGCGHNRIFYDAKEISCSLVRVGDTISVEDCRLQPYAATQGMVQRYKREVVGEVLETGLGIEEFLECALGRMPKEVLESKKETWNTGDLFSDIKFNVVPEYCRIQDDKGDVFISDMRNLRIVS